MENYGKFNHSQLESLNQSQCALRELGDWKFLQGPDMILSQELRNSLEDITSNRFHTTYKPQYPYYFQKTTGFPSPIVRIDFSPMGKVSQIGDCLYEIEARPAGIGIAVGLFGLTELKSYIAYLKKTLDTKIGAKVFPSIKGMRENTKDRRIDTEMFASNVDLLYFDIDAIPPDDMIIWARGGVEDEQMIDSQIIRKIESQSLTPVRDHGNKSYLIEMGLCERISSIDELDFDQPFCIKPEKGSKGQGIGIWIPGANKKGSGIIGTSTRTAIEKMISSGNSYLKQRYIPAYQFEYKNMKYHLIYRVFAVLNLSTNRYELIPSLYTARPNVKVHGASDSIIGIIRLA